MREHVAEEIIQRVLPTFRVTDMLGKGAFGAVFRIKDDLKERAAKFIPLNSSAGIEKGRLVDSGQKIERDFRHIIENYEKIACDEIVTVYDFYKVVAGDGPPRDNAFAIVVMELYPSNLLDYLIGYFKTHNRPIDVDRAASLLEKTALMLGNLYSKRGFLFEDLKPENILVREREGVFKVVAGDIGGLKSLGSLGASLSQVTLAYCASEIIRKGQKPDLLSMIYSYGLLGYFILEGNLPYEDRPVPDRIDLIREKGLPFHRTDVPPTIRNVLGRCVAFERHERYRNFSEVIAALSGKEVSADSTLGEETITLGGDQTVMLGAPSGPQSPSPAAGPGPGGRTGFTPLFPRSLTTPLPSPRPGTRSAGSHRAESMRLSSERGEIERVSREIRGLVVKEGSVFKIAGENLKVFGDIRVERGGLLTVENAKLFFDEKGGIFSHGAFRAVKSTFGAMDMKKKWLNVTLHPDGSRVSYVKNCLFRFGRGRPWSALGLYHSLMNESYTYGGGLCLAQSPEKSFSIADTQFHYCSAHVGGGMHLLESSMRVENCRFENCSAKVSGGGVAALASAPAMVQCLFNNCVSEKEGGGMHCGTSHAVIDRCTFQKCSARYLGGGGIAFSTSKATLSNCRFNSCAAHKTGGGIYCDGKTKPKVEYPSFLACRPDNMNCR